MMAEEARGAGEIARAARAVAGADALLVTAGAGMGVDSGLPDFRGTRGFWRAYPAYGKLGLEFEDMANPRWFSRDPELAWGFYGHRLELYRRASPHAGFSVLREIAAGMREGAFVFTSNVDGHFQKVGWDEARVFECHGALSVLQCLEGCGAPLFGSEGVRVEVDPESFRARPPLPSCPACGGLARPNVLMFGDGGWEASRAEAQEARFSAWLAFLAAAKARLAIVECGAGTAIPTVRSLGERLARSLRATLVRVNVREPEIPLGATGGGEGISLAMGALEALTELRAELDALAGR